MSGQSERSIDPSTRVSFRGWLVIHLATLVIAFGVLLAVNIHAWFLADEWDMVVRATQPLTLHAVLVPHNEHWSTVPILIYRVLIMLFGLRTYVPYMCTLFAAHLLLAHLLWRLMRQVGASDACATGLAAVFAILGAGAQNLTIAFQISFVVSALAGVGAVLIVNATSNIGARQQIGAVALMLLGLMSSNVGITMTVLVGLVVYLQHGYRIATRLVLVPAAAYIGWFAAFGHSSLASDRITLDTVLALPSYVWTGFTSSMGSFTGIVGSGGAIVVAVLVYAVWKSSLASTRQAPAFAGVLCVVVLYLTSGVVRSHFGIAQAGSTRYSYVAIALLLPIISLGVMDLFRLRDRRLGLVLGSVVLMLMVGSNLYQIAVIHTSIEAAHAPFPGGDFCRCLSSADRCTTNGCTSGRTGGRGCQHAVVARNRSGRAIAEVVVRG